MAARAPTGRDVAARAGVSQSTVSLVLTGRAEGREAITRGVVETISPSTVRRTLRRAVIKPWQHRSWIFPRDPDLETEAARVLEGRSRPRARPPRRSRPR